MPPRTKTITTARSAQYHRTDVEQREVVVDKLEHEVFDNERVLLVSVRAVIFPFGQPPRNSLVHLRCHLNVDERQQRRAVLELVPIEPTLVAWITAIQLVPINIALLA